MRLKDDSVNIRGVHTDIIAGLFRLSPVWKQALGYELVITSARDGRHHPSSRHYVGCAVDIRTWVDANGSSQLDGHRRDEVCKLVRKTLSETGATFLVIDEEDHFHIQLQEAK